MINAVIDASLFTEDGLTTDGDTYFHPLWTSKEIVDDNWYEPTFSLDHQSAINAFLEGTSLAGIAAQSDPSEITSTQVTWGNTTNGMVMSGANLSGISDIEQLEAALEGGTGQGEFDTIKVYDNGTEILSLTLAEQSVSIFSGTQSLTFHGALPQTFQEIFDFLGHIPNLEMLGDLNTADFNVLETFMSDFSLTGFEIADDGETFFGLDVTADMVHLELEGAIAELDGTFPVANLGAFVTTLNTIVTTDNVDTLSDFNAIDGIALTGMRLINDAQTTLVDIQLSDGASTFDVVGTDNWDRDVYIENIVDDEDNVVAGTYSLGGGEDTAYFDLDAYMYNEENQGYLGSVDGGEDWDRIIVRGSNVFEYGWDDETFMQTVDYYGPDQVIVDFSSGEIAGYHDDGALFNADITNFRALSINIPNFEFTGDATNNKLYIEREVDYFEFDGGDGTDQLTLKYLKFINDEGYWQEGITYDDFLENFTFDQAGNGDLRVFFADSGNQVATLTSVEEIRFYDEDQGERIISTNEIWDISDSVGTEGDDELFGNSSGNEISGLGGDDDIYGNGGNDTLIGGAGHDELQIQESASHVDGGDDWDRLYLFDPEYVLGNQEVTIVTNGSDGTVTWGTGEDALVSTFENIEAFKVDVDRWVNLTGSSDDDRIYVRDLHGLTFDGGDGIDRIYFRGLDFYDENDNRQDFTRAVFEDLAFIDVQDNGDIWIREDGEGDVVLELSDVEEIKFADGTDDGELVNIQELIESSEGGLSVIIDTPEEAVELGTGDDSITGSVGNDTVDAGGGDDRIDGGAGNDNIDSGEGSDSVLGGEGNDSIFDATGDDTIDGGEGSDTGVSLSGNNTFEDIEAETAPDYSPEIDDFYCGGSGNDVFRSGDGNDIIIGDIGSVYYFGNDVLLGGRGNDVLQAGYGADTFEFRSGDGDDVIGRVDLNALMSNWPDDIADVPMLSMADFEIGIDQVKLANFAGVTDTATLQTALANGTMSISNNADGHAVFDSGNGTITFNEIDANDLTVDHFIF